MKAIKTNGKSAAVKKTTGYSVVLAGGSNLHPMSCPDSAERELAVSLWAQPIQTSSLSSKVPIIDVIIPAYNEEESIALVVNELPKDMVRDIIVCNNNSKDNTANVARNAGAVVVEETRAGYGSACLRGMAHIAARPRAEHPDIVVFIDGDHSDYPEQLPELTAPILNNEAELVIGSRALGDLEPGSMQPQQIFGNWLATTLIKLIYGISFTDLGPFRAIRYDKLISLGMNDPDFGWTVEMQVRAAKAGLRCTEVPVRYRNRIGVSKISGTLRGTILAGHKILWTIFKLI